MTSGAASDADAVPHRHRPGKVGCSAGREAAARPTSSGEQGAGQRRCRCGVARVPRLVVARAALSAVARCAGQTIPGRARPAGDVDPGSRGRAARHPGAQRAAARCADGETPGQRLHGHGDGPAGRGLRRGHLHVLALRAALGLRQAVHAGAEADVVRLGRRRTCRCAARTARAWRTPSTAPPTTASSWDRGTLLPALDQMFGPMAVVTVFAHEMGHAVQFRLGSVNQATPRSSRSSRPTATRARSSAGSPRGRRTHFRLSTGDGLNSVLSTMMFIRDQVGTTGRRPAGARQLVRPGHGVPVRLHRRTGALRQDRRRRGAAAHHRTGLHAASPSRTTTCPSTTHTLALLEQGLTTAFKSNRKAAAEDRRRRPARAPTAPARHPRRTARRTTRSPSTWTALNELAALPPNDDRSASAAARASVTSRRSRRWRPATRWPCSTRGVSRWTTRTRACARRA